MGAERAAVSIQEYISRRTSQRGNMNAAKTLFKAETVGF